MIDEMNLNEEAEYYAKSVFRYYEAAHACKLGFMAVAEWAQKEFFESLWHDASEEPKYRMFILLEVACKVIDRYAVYFTDGSNSWADICSRVGVIRWLYIDDLLPKEGGEE